MKHQGGKTGTADRGKKYKGTKMRENVASGGGDKTCHSSPLFLSIGGGRGSRPLSALQRNLNFTPMTTAGWCLKDLQQESAGGVAETNKIGMEVVEEAGEQSINIEVSIERSKKRGVDSVRTSAGLSKTG